MPKAEKTDSQGGETAYRVDSSNRDLEANKKTPGATPITPTFPGATYGFNQSDQPSVPPRRISSAHSLKHSRSITSIHANAEAPPPLPAPYFTNSSQLPPPGTSTNAHVAATQPDVRDVANDDELGEELAWGPAHPCFPHMNPHVPIDSPEYKSTRIIRIRRDWMVAGDLAPTYSNVYPEILDPLVPEMVFRQIIDHINASLLKAFDPFSIWNWFDGLLGLATGWVWEDFRPGGAKGQLRELERWMEQWNSRTGSKDGVRLISLRRTGYLELDIEIPDPQVRVVSEDEQQQQHQQQAQQQSFQQPGNSIGGMTGDGDSLSFSRHDQMGQFGHITSGPTSTAPTTVR